MFDVADLYLIVVFRILILVILGFRFSVVCVCSLLGVGSVDCYSCRLCVVFLCCVWVGV